MTIIVLFFGHLVSAQDADESPRTPVGHLEARAIPPLIHVGDEVRLVIQAEFPKGFSIEPLSPKIDFKPFELRSIDKPLFAKKGSRVLQTVTVRLTLFQMGDFKIPSIPLTVWNIAGQRAEARTPEIPVRVVSVGKTKDDKTDIRPIKGPVETSLAYLYYGLLGIAAFLLTVFLAVKVFLRRRKKSFNRESFLPPADRLALELHRLAENDWISLGKIKEHYSELSDILRRYLERRYGFDVMEHTSAEVAVMMKQKNFTDDITTEVRDILEKSDLVKFARFVPERDFAAEIEKRLKAFADRTRPVESSSKKP